jgi:hypothetical protein
MEKQGPQKHTVSKYFNLYKHLKMLFEKNIDINYYRILSKQNNTNPDFICWLIKQNAVLKDRIYKKYTYKWNNNIPVTEELIILYLNYKYEYNLSVRKQRKNKIINEYIKTQHTKPQDNLLFISKRRRHVRGNTINKYLKVCNELKNKCDNKIKFSVNEERIQLKFSNALGTFLRLNNIMNIDSDGFHKWNEKIPITNKLIISYLDYTHKTNKEYRLKQKSEETPTLFNSPHYIKDAIKGTVTVIPEGKEKEYIERNKFKQTKEFTEIGLIRKFWKWIY